MKIKAVVLNVSLREGKAKKTGNDYKFYTGQAYVPVAGLIEFVSNFPVNPSLNFDKGVVSLVEIDLEAKGDGKFNIVSVG